jgi:prefoldin alpha subunit
MTQSLYVPGTLVDVGNVLVDIGTGYFVTKTNDQAKDFLQRKITLLEKNSKAVEGVIAAKYQNLEMVARVMDKNMRKFQEEQHVEDSTAT